MLESTLPGPLVSSSAAGEDRRDCRGPGPTVAQAPLEEGRTQRHQNLAGMGE